MDGRVEWQGDIDRDEESKHNKIMASHVCDAFLLRLVHTLILLRLFLWTAFTGCLQKLATLFWKLTENQNNKRLIFRCRNDSRSLQKIPLHIAFQVYENDISDRDVSNILVWCIALGVPYVTVCDSEGHCKKGQSSLRQTLEKKVAEVCAGTDEQIFFQLYSRQGSDASVDRSKKSAANNSTNIAFLSSQDGRADIVDSAKRLCQDVSEKRIRAEDVDIPHLDQYINELNGYPDPDLIIQFGRTECLLGFSPWKIRVTEIMTLPSHHNVDYFSLLSVLRTFSRTQQRFGK